MTFIQAGSGCSYFVLNQENKLMIGFLCFFVFVVFPEGMVHFVAFIVAKVISSQI